MSLNEYLDLPQSFGLNEYQRDTIFLRNKELLREGNINWDELILL